MLHGFCGCYLRQPEGRPSRTAIYSEDHLDSWELYSNRNYRTCFAVRRDDMTPWSYLQIDKKSKSPCIACIVGYEKTYPKSVKPVPVTKAIAAVNFCPLRDSLRELTSVWNAGESTSISLSRTLVGFSSFSFVRFMIPKMMFVRALATQDAFSTASCIYIVDSPLSPKYDQRMQFAPSL